MIENESSTNPFRSRDPLENLPLVQESDNIAEYAVAMARFQAECPCPPSRGKNPRFRGPGGEPSRYALLQDVIDTVTPVLGAHGLSFSQRPNIRRVQVEREGKIVSVPHAIIVTTVRHESGQWERSFGMWPVDPGPTSQDGKRVMSPAQAIKAALTYARTAELCSILGIAGSEDADGNDPEDSPAQPPRRRNGAPRNPSPSQAPPSPPPRKEASSEDEDPGKPQEPSDLPMSSEQRSAARALCAKLGKTSHKDVLHFIQDVCGQGVTPESMTQEQGQKVIDALERTLKDLGEEGSEGDG